MDLKLVKTPGMIIETMIHIEGSKVSKSDGSHSHKGLRWLNAKLHADSSFIKIIGNKKKFNFHPYAYNEA